jgi:hypothetical protein
MLLLSFLACLVSATACFFPKWFEYSADWAPCKSTSKESPCPSHTQEQLSLFGVGPGTLAQQLEGVDDIGCYVAGMCNPREVPHRLYQADFTEAQQYAVFSMRFAGILGIAASILCLLLTSLKHLDYLRLLYSQKPTAFVIGCLLLILIVTVTILLCILQSTTPSAFALLGSEEYPVHCQTSPPQAIECGYPRTSSDGERYVAYEPLRSGTSKWQFEKVLFPGPVWMLFSFMLVSIVWLRGRLWPVRNAG